MKTKFTFRNLGFIVLLLTFLFNINALAQNMRTFSGTVLTQQFELVPNVTVEVQTSNGKLNVQSDAEGRFLLQVPNESLSVKFFGKHISPVTRIFAVTDTITDLQIKISYIIAPVNENVTIRANPLTPEIEQRNEEAFKNKIFVARDDQVIQSLNAGISAGQHEGGGKSIEIRRFGFNLDHGGVNGGLKVLVDNFQQNQVTQGHGQGFLGSLKSLSSELIEDVTVINGPFSAQFGDFSGLGVVQIHQKESLPQQLTLRFQAGSFDSYRTFLAYSPKIKNIASFISYEGAYTNGPFLKPLNYRRDNLTGNITYKIDDSQAIGFKLNYGRNNFSSSGEIPLDEVVAGRLDRFGVIDPFNDGKNQQGIIGAYYRKEFKSGQTFKVDGFLRRSLFDLTSDFTFFLLDPVYGDQILQHDSRLEEGVNSQYLLPYKLFGRQSLLTFGGNFHASQINVSLTPTFNGLGNRKFFPGNINNPDVTYTLAHANVNNYAGYVQNGIDFASGHVHVEAGLRFDNFTFDVNGFEQTDVNRPLIGKQSATKFQPKLSAVWSPFEKFPISFYGNYGRGISSQDARGVIRNPDSPKVSTTDFYQTGAVYNGRRFSVAPNFFFIDRSNEQVYIPDDGSIEFAGRSRSYGAEIKTFVRFNKFLSFNGGVTQVFKAFYLGQFTEDVPRRRIVVDTAPHTTANGSLILTAFRGFDSWLSWRHISNYRLDGSDRSIVASGYDIVDFSLSKHLKKWMDVNFSIDNILNKKYFETQQYHESRLRSDAPVGIDPETGRNIYPSRIHFTPGFGTTFNFGVTFRLFAKE
ncbi:MAG: TonB-dependent receptor plug domain-containing protein [Actinomycetota bacterium]